MVIRRFLSVKIGYGTFLIKEIWGENEVKIKTKAHSLYRSEFLYCLDLYCKRRVLVFVISVNG